MADWRAYIDSSMIFNKQPLLQGFGRMSHQAMITVAHERNEQFDSLCRKAEALDSNGAHLRKLEQVEKQSNSRKSKGKGGKDAA